MRQFFKSILVFILLVLALIAGTQSFTYIYDFSPARQFSGDSIYNPYKGMDSTQWKKANFHAHQRWMLFSMDFEYTAEQFIEAYKEKGYDVIVISDHQQINPYTQISNYEHGIGAHKFHLLMIGATKVSWFDHIFMVMPQHQMQFQINKFKPQVKLLAINHPSRTTFIPISVYDNLTGYDLMEINPDFTAKAWDRALSNGIYSSLLADDDAHSISDRGSRFQRFYTMVNTSSLAQDDILKALKDGRSYGVAITVEQNQKTDPHEGLPRMEKASFVNDTISLKFDTKFDSVRFIGQDARILSRVIETDSTNTASYQFSQNDTYVRAEAFFKDGTHICTNPFHRMGGIVREPVEINVLLTTINSILWSVLAIFILWLTYRVIRLKGKKRNDNYYGW